MSENSKGKPGQSHGRVHHQHDKAYRLLFSFPEMVRDALKIIQEPWVDALDFSTLEKMAESRVSERLDLRFQDVVWRVRCRDTDIYLCLLIEFQSTIDPYMIHRISFYQAAFYADQIRQLQDKEKPNPLVYFVEDQAGHRYAKLPLAIPIVCYNGKPIWWSPVNLVDALHIPPGFEDLAPNLSYVLLDEHRIPEERLAAKNLLAALIGLEKSDSVDGLYVGFNKILSWSKKPAIRRAFAVYVKKSLVNAGLINEAQDVSDPEEIQNMLAENLIEWRERVAEEALKKGREEGREEGIKKGIKKGREEGQLQGEALIVTRQIQLKFGPLDGVTQKRIAEADSETLLRWADRVLTAEHLSKIFEEG